jgi:hypothetical protein
MEGDIFLTGDSIEFDFNGETLERKIKGIDNGMRVEKGKPNVGIMIEAKDKNEISDLRNWNPNLTIGKIYSNRETELDSVDKIKSDKTNLTTLNGIIQIVLSLLWISHFGNLYYKYHFTDILFAFMLPDWTLILFMLMGILGIVIGLSVLFGKKKIKTGYFQIFGLLIVGIIIEMIVVA